MTDRLNRELAEACKTANQLAIDRLIEDGADDWQAAFESACRGGHPAIAESMIKRGEIGSLHEGLRLGCLNGHESIVRLLLPMDVASQKSHGATSAFYCDALSAACEGGNRRLVDFVINQFKQSGDPYTCTFQFGLEGACAGGHRKLVDLMVRNGGGANWNGGLEAACRTGQDRMIDLALKNGADDFSNAFLAATMEVGQEKAAHRMLDLGADDFGYPFKNACRNGMESVVRRILADPVAAVDCDDGLAGACEGGHKSIIKLMIDNGADDWNGGLAAAADGNQPEIVQMMIDAGADDVNSALFNASWMYRLLVLQILADNGANDWNRALHPTATCQQDVRIQAFVICKGATNCRSTFDVRKDWPRLLKMLQTTDVRRSMLADIEGIQQVFDRADAFVMAARIELDRFMPIVLQTVVAEYCVNLV